MAKPKVAFFDFASCEGCQLAVLDLGPQDLLDLLAVVDIVEFREAISETADAYDIALIEGSITRKSDEARLKDIRARSGLVITLGACSSIGGINALKNFHNPANYKQAVYPTDPDLYETGEVRAVGEVIDVDGFIPGCPIDTKEFVRVVKNLALGKNPGLPDYPVCVECKLNENVCVYEKGMQCLGPVVRAGCEAVCTSNGGYCFGCRGLISDPNVNSQQDIMQKYDLTFDKMMDKFKLFLGRDQRIFQKLV